MKKIIFGLVGLALLAGGCEQPEFAPGTREIASYKPDTPGSHEMLRAPITVSDVLEVLISDVVIPPNGTVPLHYHPGEEFLYVIEGTATHRQDGIEDLVLKPGDNYVIPPSPSEIKT